MVLKEGQVRIPETCEYVTFHGEGGFADGHKVLEMGRGSWITQVATVESQSS